MKSGCFGLLHDFRMPNIWHQIFSTSIIIALLLQCPPVWAQKNDVPPRVTGAQSVEAATRLDYLFNGQIAIRLLPPKMIIGQGVTRAEWSPDGRFILAARVPPVKEPLLAVPVSIALWDKTTQRSIELWSRRLTAPVLAGPTQWLEKAQVAALRLRWMESDENGAWSIKEGIVWVNGAQGVAREVESQPGDSLFLSPIQAGGVILHGKPQVMVQSFSVIAPDGSISPHVPMPDGVHGYDQLRWQADGKQFFLEMYVAATEQDKKDGVKIEDRGFDGPSRKQWFAVDMTQQRLFPLDKDPGGVSARPGSILSPNTLPGAGESRLCVKSTPTGLKQGSVETPIHPLWLETIGSKPMSALLCADGERGLVAPSGEAVLYLAQTGVWVTILHRTPRTLFTATVLAAHQDDVRYRAWTLAQAVRMWSTAHKGVLPRPEEALSALQSLMPAEQLYEGFRYVWTGGALPADARPAETVVAEILGPGGIAQIFADGRSAWKSSD